MSKKHNIPVYLKSLIQKNPKIVSGRKNFSQHHIRIINTLAVVKEYFKIKK